MGWILDFLTNRRTQRVKDGEWVLVRGAIIVNRLTPGVCPLAIPLQYILYTDDCRSQNENRYILKFTDHSVIVSLLHDKETAHGPVVNDFVHWCDSVFLQLNVTKTNICVLISGVNPIPLRTLSSRARR